jgi:diguanylate cyclase (GGDEF)-like protein
MRADRQVTQICSAIRLILGALLCALVASHCTAQQAAPLTQISAIRSLTAEQAREARPVHLRGVVTVLSGWKNSFFFQDESAGISVNRTSNSPELHQGQEVEVSGVTSPGMFAPLVIANEVRVLGNGNLPSPAPVELSKLAGGKFDSQWVSIQGAVRTASVKPSWGSDVLFLDIDAGGGTLITARIHDFKDSNWQALPTSIISVRGVCATAFNDKRQFVGLRLFVSSVASDVKILKPAPADPFDRPLRPLGGLLRFDPDHDTITPVKVRGVVTQIQPGIGLYLQDGNDGVFVRGSQMAPISIGAQVEAVGFPGGGDYSPSLESSIFRQTKAAPAPLAPIPATPAAMIVESEGFSTSPYDSRLVQITGRLEQSIPGVDERVLFLHNGDFVFTARLPASAGIKGIPPIGSEVQVTGVCATRVDPGHEARSFRILLRSASDIVVVKSAPWWNESRAKPIVAILLVVVCLLIGALVIVRRESGLRQLALTDPLTGLYNRRGFILIAEHQWRLTQRNHTTFLLFYIDLNDFKTINDTYGHKQGDLALKQVTNVLHDCFRNSDLIGRLGGDEFIVAAVDATPSAASALEERLEECMRQSNQKSASKFDLSLSIGTLVCDDSTRSVGLEELIDRADALMYENKRARKSQRSRQTTAV